MLLLFLFLEKIHLFVIFMGGGGKEALKMSSLSHKSHSKHSFISREKQRVVAKVLASDQQDPGLRICSDIKLAG